MLVLSRKPGQRVVLPDQEVIINVVSVHGQVVRLGIEAPPDVSIFREEVLIAMDFEHSQRRSLGRFRTSEKFAQHFSVSASE